MADWHGMKKDPLNVFLYVALWFVGIVTAAWLLLIAWALVR